jgi:ubiquinone/menaquinone biosynthesis C-methylase UbiE
MDPQPEMLVEGQAAAEGSGVSNIEWLRGGSEDLSPTLGHFRMVTIGNAFHWMDRQRTLDKLYDLLLEGGGLAVVGHGAPIPAPPPTPWRAAINKVVRLYLGELPLPWEGPFTPPEQRHEAYIARSHFKDVTQYEESFDIQWTIDSIIGNLYSTSFCNRRILGDRAEAFERDLRSAVLAAERSGDLSGEQQQFFALMAWKR